MKMSLLLPMFLLTLQQAEFCHWQWLLLLYLPALMTSQFLYKFQTTRDCHRLAGVGWGWGTSWDF